MALFRESMGPWPGDAEDGHQPVVAVPQGRPQGGAADGPHAAQGHRRAADRQPLLVPSLVLTTGRKMACPASHRSRAHDRGWWVVGSNFGQEAHPAWTGNLIAEPKATVSYEGTTYDVEARLLTDDEKAEVWPTLTSAWPAYDQYVKSSGRNIRVFDLQPT
ncbi:MAG: nitroreductase/quinone reductase family protein [Acidimicrobiales bacterium]